MDIFDVLELIGGLALFLFGMQVMGKALEKTAGGQLSVFLEKMTDNRFKACLTGMATTAVIQSSSATTVMVVGFVNSGIMQLSRAISVIMGCEIGTTVTAWILSLAGINSDNVFVKMLKPSSFTPILAIIGIAFLMFSKREKKHNIGTIFLGFATLMFGMETMTGAVSSLKDIPEFQNIFIMFENPLLGVLAGMVLTAIVQSSSASIGILQALAITGSVTYASAIPIIMGQNIGTCITALLSSIGANVNARRTALSHLSFNIIGTSIWITVFLVVKNMLQPAMLDASASLTGIALLHSLFNISSTVVLLPFVKYFEKLVCKLIPDKDNKMDTTELDERFLETPKIALEQSRNLTYKMLDVSKNCYNLATSSLLNYDEKLANEARECEENTDYYEDIISNYLVKLNTSLLSEEDNISCGKILKIVGDAERIGDHSINIIESIEEMNEKEIKLEEDDVKNLSVLFKAVADNISLINDFKSDKNMNLKIKAEALEDIVDDVKDELRDRYITNLRKHKYGVQTGFILSDIITDLERISDHCNNIQDTLFEDNKILTHDKIIGEYDKEEYKKVYEELKSNYVLV